MSERVVTLGPCCRCCLGQATAILMLRRRSPTPGKGWGCFQCGLPCDGAVAVLCERCADALAGDQPRFGTVLEQLQVVCTGYPASDGRTPIAELAREPFDHDLSRHPRHEWYCQQCGCTDEDACIDEQGEPCHWVAPGRCSHCPPPERTGPAPRNGKELT